ncbi:MAG: ATP-binding protein [Bacteroidales bacterium]|nr:MAG: ATP-binding protein [Bacteroidales bacterium]
MTKIIRLATVLICISSFASFGQQTDVPAFLCSELEFVWESENSLEIPESVFYDADNTCIYVSNIKGTPSNQDGNGYISKLNLKGEITTHKWITGLDAPKGMAKYGNFLFVSDINDLAVIDIAKGEIVKKYPAPTAIFLNDVTLNPKNGTVYVSDSRTQSIYRLKNEVFELWIKDEQLDHINGLTFKDNFICAGVLNKILKIEPASKLINTLVNNTKSIDGLLNIGEKKWISSDWIGNIQLIDDGEIKKLLSSAEQQINAADLGYIPEQKIILVPTFHNNRVIAYQLKL